MRQLSWTLPSTASHPYRVDSPADLPDRLRQPAWQTLGPSDCPHCIFVVPAQVFPKAWLGWRRVPEQALLFTSQGVIHVQDSASPGGAAQVTYMQGSDLLYAQISLLLLYGRLELVGQVSGQSGQVVVEFNTVGWQLLQPSLQQLLRLAWGQNRIQVPAEAAAGAILKRLETLPLKFRNGLRLEGLQRNESLLGFAFQPAIWVPRYRFFHHQVSATTLLALTEREVIVVEEERTGRHAAYGWILTFYPLACITGIKVSPGQTHQELEIHLGRGGVALVRQISLEQDTVAEWQEIWIRHGGAWAGPNESLPGWPNAKQPGNR